MKKGESLPRVNSLVDVANALSVQLQVPVGLYDLGKVKGEELAVRLGRRTRVTRASARSASTSRAGSASPTPKDHVAIPAPTRHGR